MKSLLFIVIFLSGLVTFLSAQTSSAGRYALWTEVSNRNAGIGIQYAIRNRWFLPLSAGISNEFHEKKWNDWYMSIQPYYLWGERKIQFPVGILGGVRFMNDYGSHFPVFFYGGYGGILYRTGSHAIGVNVGIKYGKKYHQLHYSGIWGNVAASETYRERPVFFSVRYQFYFRGR